MSRTAQVEPLGGRPAPGRTFDFLIVGAGVIGTVMACLLVSRKLAEPGRVAVIAEQFGPTETHRPDWDLRVFALNRASQRLLTYCGIWQSLVPAKRHAYERMCVWDATDLRPTSGALRFDCAELGEPNLGFIVEGRALQARCRETARAAGVVFLEAHVAAVVASDTAVRVALNDGRELAGQLLIAADGVDSVTRCALGIETAGHAYHQDALVAHVRTSQPHEDTAWQRFLPGGPLAFLPLPDGRSSIVWSAARAEAERLRALEPAQFNAALTTASGGVLGDCELTTPLASFPLKLQYALDYARPRAVLVGDAAHAVHPLAGQGLNLGLLDCASLADVLTSGGSAGYWGEYRPLRRYERRRKADNLLAATALDGLERLFANDNPALARLRAVGLSAVGKLPFVKRELAERALGLRGDLPEFLREATS